MAHVPLLALQVLHLQPPGCYGIAYDFYTRPLEDDLPDGWFSRRARTYETVIDYLKQLGFNQAEYSDYHHPFIHPITVYIFMLVGLPLVLPPSKLATTIRRLKMEDHNPWQFYDVTPLVQLGGPASPALFGPTPLNLCLGVLAQPVQIPPAPFALPAHTRQSHNSLNRNNWRQ